MRCSPPALQPAPNYFEDLDRTYGALQARACVNGFVADLKAIEAAAKTYSTVIPFGRIRLDDSRALDDLKAFHDAGFKGLKEPWHAGPRFVVRY